MEKEEMKKELAEDAKKLDERMQALVAGKIKPMNDYQEYAIEEYRKAAKEFNAAQDEVTKMTQMLTEAKQHTLVLRGKVNTHGDSIVAWDKQAPAQVIVGPEDA